MRKAVILAIAACWATPAASNAPALDGGEAAPLIIGPIDKEVIRSVIHEHGQQVRDCYEAELRLSASVASKVRVAFTILATGAVTRVAVADATTPSTGLEACLVARVQTWVFPRPRGGGIVKVTYPFVFAVVAGDAGH